MIHVHILNYVHRRQNGDPKISFPQSSSVFLWPQASEIHLIHPDSKCLSYSQITPRLRGPREESGRLK